MAPGGGGHVVPLELATLDELADALVDDEVDVADTLDPVDEEAVELCTALEPCGAVELDVAPPPPACWTTVPEQAAWFRAAAITAKTSARATPPPCPLVMSASLPGGPRAPAASSHNRQRDASTVGALPPRPRFDEPG
jgi:hypothetical protein